MRGPARSLLWCTSNHASSLYLQALEAESIHIFREAVAEFENPVMLYLRSWRATCSAMLRLAQKAFAPASLPFPLLHIDTTWKFREMIAHRDRAAKELGAELLVYTNPDGLGAERQPLRFTGGELVHDGHEDRGVSSSRRSRSIKLRLRLRRGAPRRRALAGQGARLFLPGPLPPVGSQTSGRSSGRSTTARINPRESVRLLSRSPTGPSSTSGSTSGLEKIPIVPSLSRQAAAGRRPLRVRSFMVDDERMRPRARRRRSVEKSRPVSARWGCYPLSGASCRISRRRRFRRSPARNAP